MESERLITFLFGAGSAGTVVGSFMLWRLKQFMSNVDHIPHLVKSIENMRASVDSFSGELKSMERMMYANQKDVAVINQKVDAAFRQIDSINRDVNL